MSAIAKSDDQTVLSTLRETDSVVSIHARETASEYLVFATGGVHMDTSGRFSIYTTPLESPSIDLSLSNPGMRLASAELRVREPNLTSLFGSGAIQEGRDGFLQSANFTDVPLQERRDINTAIASVNEYRRVLYQELGQGSLEQASEATEAGTAVAQLYLLTR